MSQPKAEELERILRLDEKRLARVHELPVDTESDNSRWPPSRLELMATKEEMDRANLTPTCIVRNYLYADVGQIVSPGGTGKTTMLLHESICIALKRPVWGMETVTAGWTLIVTKEDQRERLVARLREIMNEMALSDNERATVLANVIFLDVTGSDRKLLFVADGNIARTKTAQDIVAAYREDPPIHVIFDPTVSFGASEGMVNDNEQALIEVARYVVRELGCCFRYVHHTGKANARAKETDQYSGRGGSALADGSRMTVVLESWNKKDPPPPGCTISGFATAFKLHRHKISHAPPNQPAIWVRREGFRFDAFTELQRTPEEREKAQMDQVELFLASRLKSDEYHTRRSLEAQADKLSMRRGELRAAIETLAARGRLVESDLPETLRQGRRKAYLRPVNYCAEKVT